MNEPKLPVVIPYFNHTNARVNRRLLEESLDRLALNPNCAVVLAEGIWNPEAELPDFSQRVHRHLKYRYPQALWVKENLINLALRDCGMEWECAAWIDKDVEFLDEEWAAKAVETLLFSDIIQPWSHVRFRGAKGNLMEEGVIQKDFSIPAPSDVKGILSLCGVLSSESSRKSVGHGGMAWGITHDFYRKIGGLYDRCVFGGGDRFLTAFLFPEHAFTETIRNVHGAALDRFMKRCVGAKTGFVEGLIVHHYHGEIRNRHYRSRYIIAEECGFDPSRDLSHARDETIRIDNPKLERAILEYLLSREEHLVT